MKEPSTLGSQLRCSDYDHRPLAPTAISLGYRPYLVRELRWKGVHGGLQHVERKLAQTLQRIGTSLTPALCNKEVVVLLPAGEVTDGQGRARIHDRPAEQALVVPIISNQVRCYGKCACGPTPSMND